MREHFGGGVNVPPSRQAGSALGEGATTDAEPLAVGVPVKVSLPPFASEGDSVALDIEISYGPTQPSIDDSAPMPIELAYSDLNDWVRPPLGVIASDPVTLQNGNWKRFAVVSLQTRDRSDVPVRPSFVIVTSATMRKGEVRVAVIQINLR
ncbi:MAG: hypothetical protein SGJ09_02015 [Phycisphaerae bacterium]|nr:hypothetical protein [Phycisphaerae bacterium]